MVLPTSTAVFRFIYSQKTALGCGRLVTAGSRVADVVAQPVCGWVGGLFGLYDVSSGSCVRHQHMLVMI